VQDWPAALGHYTTALELLHSTSVPEVDLSVDLLNNRALVRNLLSVFVRSEELGLVLELVLRPAGLPKTGPI
jgi:hypothetical protein